MKSNRIFISLEWLTACLSKSPICEYIHKHIGDMADILDLVEEIDDKRSLVCF